MAKFKFVFHREVVEIDEVERVIEAGTADEAHAIADQMASEFNQSCPDDTQTIAGGDCQDWYVEYSLPVSDDTPADEVPE